MAVYLGDAGLIEIRRDSLNVPLTSVLNTTDVNVAKRRFSFDFEPEALITGDRLFITTTDRSPLVLVAGHDYPDGYWYCHVDQVGGIRLYEFFEDAVNGGYGNALALIEPTVPQSISVKTIGRGFRCVAQTRSWEMTTTRENVDITTLGEEHRRFYANGLVSGQGSLTCLWDHRHELCSSTESDGTFSELPQYFAELVLRVQQGASFDGRFFLTREGYQPLGGVPNTVGVWLEAKCVITNVGLSFQPGAVVESQISYVTTGPVHLRMGQRPDLLLKEDGGLLLQESGDGGILLENDA
ncbi:MAG: hypothetical protein LW834_12070 [Cyanobium sp. 49614_E6]|jgi:hypothetical protein|nr:hypothetical protein [Cyanobium sp. 49614_E6]MCE2837678.1 hypothetical protein [Cyanobium sp. 49614_E6]